MKSIAIVILATAAVGAFLVWAANRAGSAPPAAGSGTLTASETSYDFGTISMARGKVSKMFSVKNTGAGAVNVSRLYTSCMCTAAYFIKGSDRRGPFGMMGHGFIPPVNETVAPGEIMNVEVIFDPAAHGPAGVGKIARTVNLEGAASAVTFSITANVIP